jgi:glycosyltransferase involved in cell wall biosynthesis
MTRPPTRSIMRISVIIPTRDRMEKLRRTLQSLESQEDVGEDAEVIVVDNGSTDGTVAFVRDLRRAFKLDLTLVEEAVPGASSARNAGIGAARSDVILFLDDDKRAVDRGLLRAHIELHRRRPEREYAVLGLVRWAPELGVTPLMDWLDSGPLFDYANMKPGAASVGQMYSAHVSIKRAMLDLTGGFDDQLPFQWEDLELAARLFARGLRLDYRPELVVEHDHFFALDDWLRRQRVVGRLARHMDVPELNGTRLVPRPAGAKWLGVRIAGRALGPVRTEWAWLPKAPRDLVYRILHLTAYSDGYRRGGRLADPFAETA